MGEYEPVDCVKIYMIEVNRCASPGEIGVKQNLRLVVRIARGFTGLGVPLLDLIQAGSMGLMRAAEKFNPSLGFKFSTYAYPFIRQKVDRAVTDLGRTIRVPRSAYETLGKIKKVSSTLEQNSGREPSDEQIAKRLKIRASRVSELRRADQPIMSLDQQIGDDEELTIGNSLPDENGCDPKTILQRLILREALESLPIMKH